MALGTIDAVARPEDGVARVRGPAPRVGSGFALGIRRIRGDRGARWRGTGGDPDANQAPPATSGPRQGPGRRVEIAVALIALAPFVTVALPFSLGLRVQAGLILLLLVVLCVLGRDRLRPWMMELSPPARWALAAWVVSAVWGAAVGWCASNPTRYVVSQFVAMGLLPLGALAFGAQPHLTGRRIATGLSVAAVGAVGIHALALALRATPAQRQGEPLRLVLANDVGATGMAPAALLFVAAGWWIGAARRGSVGFAASLLLVAGSMSRGAWLVSLAGLAALAAWASRERGGAAVRRGLLVVAAGAAALMGLAAASPPGAVVWSLGAERLEDGGTSDRHPAAVAIQGRRALPLPAAGDAREHILAADLGVAAPAVEVTCLTLGPRDGRGRLTVRGVDESGQAVVRSDIGLGTGGGWVRTDRVVLLPPQVRSVSIAVWTGGDGWYLSGITVRAVRSALGAWLKAAGERAIGLAWLPAGLTGDANLLYRGHEAAAVMRRWREASPLRVVTGEGLGATFAFSNASYDEHGNRVFLAAASYIHNFYLFLAFKLGLAGLVALAALLGFVLQTAAAALGRTRSPDGRWVCAATAVVFGAYLVWGVTSPEIIDFRVAPLLGAVLAVSQVARGRR